jgi:hypothetical protein
MNPRITATSVHLVARRSVSSRERLELEAAAGAWLVVFPFIHLTLALAVIFARSRLLCVGWLI